MISRRIRVLALGLGLLVVLAMASQWGGAIKAAPPTKQVTLMHLSDVHGHMVPHAEIFPDGRVQTESGGLAKLATVIGDVRDDVGEGNSLLLMVGDATHGSAEALFTVGDAVMPAFNALGIDAFTPGNWEFGYGPAVFRNRFAALNPQPGNPPLPLPFPPNTQTSLSVIKPECDGTAPAGVCNVEEATFDTVANNLYTTASGKLVLPPFVIKDVGGLKVAVIGITSSIVPQQAAVFNVGLTFTTGFVELPGDIAAAKAAGADIIVVQSELGLPGNVQLAKEIPGIDVMLSAHTHEELVNPIIVTNAGGQTIVVESGEDAFLGRLDLTLKKGKVTGFTWDLIEVDDAVAEDSDMKAIVAAARAPFLDGTCHTFGTAGFSFGEGHTLCDSLETVVGTTEVTLERRDVFEDVVNNFISDAVLDTVLGADSTGMTIQPGKESAFSMTNGFRFDIPVLGSTTSIPAGSTPRNGHTIDPDGTAGGEITVGDLYYYFPIGPAVAVTEFTGGVLSKSFEEILDAVFDPNPYRQRGGWWMGFSDNVSMTIDLDGRVPPVGVKDAPLSISSGRILKWTINDEPLDKSRVYLLASCYPHGDSTDRNCRTFGGRNLRILAGKLNDDGTVSKPYKLVKPENTEAILVPTRSPKVLQVAPDNFVHPVDLIREFLKTTDVTLADFGVGLGRQTAVPGVPVSDCDPAAGSIVQPIQGAGPTWLGRGILASNPCP